jgi:biopolymer transport protein ExbD
MGVQIASKGGRRQVNAELNLVPFIDLLSVCVTFLIATAVWIEIASIPVDQKIGGPVQIDPEPPPPPLTVHLAAYGARIGRGADVVEVQRMADAFAWAEIERVIAVDRASHEDQRQVVIVTDDGLPYRDMIRALDLTRTHGYDETLLGGD